MGFGKYNNLEVLEFWYFQLVDDLSMERLLECWTTRDTLFLNSQIGLGRSLYFSQQFFGNEFPTPDCDVVSTLSKVHQDIESGKRLILFVFFVYFVVKSSENFQ
jgi:hypothetical protein